MPSFLVTIISIIVLIILFIVIGSMLYRKVGPNEVLIVTGGLLKGKNIQENADLGTHMKVVKGGGGSLCDPGDPTGQCLFIGYL